MGMADPTAKPRWFRLTPGCCVLGLLVLEGFLLVSEHFRWFTINQDKGWTVLIALAAVGLTLLLMFFWFLAALLFHWHFQYSLRSLLLLVVVVAIPCSWLATEMQWAREQEEAVEAIWKAGGGVTYDYEVDASDEYIQGAEPAEPVWLRRLLGDDFFATPTGVGFLFSQDTDTALEHLRGLPQLSSLYLGSCKVTDAGLEHLRGLTKL